MRRLLLALALAAPLHAQAYRHPVPDCNLAARRSDGGLMLRRYEWHAIGLAEGVGGALVVRKAFRLPMLAAVSVVPTVTLVLHVRGSVLHQYGATWRDWAFDALLRSAPAFYQLGTTGKTWQSTTLAVTSFTASYLAGACFASP